MRKEQFEILLTSVAEQLTREVRKNAAYQKSREFEQRVREIFIKLGKEQGVEIELSPHPHIFPDIAFGEFGVEVKATNQDSWRSVANSVFEGTRSKKVKHVYLLFGKMGGLPEVRWGKYEDCVMHVRTSHVPRFEVEINAKTSLFKKLGITYEEFSALSPEKKMPYIRKYARSRMKPGERLWWLEDMPEQEHSLPLEVRLYMRLPQAEKRRLRAEAALLCPQIVKPSRTRDKYNDATLYLLTYHGVLCPQARDLFSAGSVALRKDETRGGIYIMRALKDIEAEMKEAARTLEDALFKEYWGRSVPPYRRIPAWLKRADSFAKGWKPSAVLFKN